MSAVTDPFGAMFGGKSWADSKVDPNLKGFQDAEKAYKNNIDKNTGVNAYNASYNTGMSKAKELADTQTRLAANGAASQALGSMTSAGHTKGRAAAEASNIAANQYANMYGQNFGNAFNGQQNAYAQQLANQQNAYGTLMSSNIAADQAKYNQNWNNQKQASKASTGPLGMVMDAISDESLKDKAKVGIDDEKDLRMAHYKRCSDKLKRMNPNKWKELRWEGK